MIGISPWSLVTQNLTQIRNQKTDMAGLSIITLLALATFGMQKASLGASAILRKGLMVEERIPLVVHTTKEDLEVFFIYEKYWNESVASLMGIYRGAQIFIKEATSLQKKYEAFIGLASTGLVNFDSPKISQNLTESGISTALHLEFSRLSLIRESLRGEIFEHPDMIPLMFPSPKEKPFIDFMVEIGSLLEITPPPKKATDNPIDLPALLLDILNGSILEERNPPLQFRADQRVGLKFQESSTGLWGRLAQLPSSSAGLIFLRPLGKDLGKKTHQCFSCDFNFNQPKAIQTDHFLRFLFAIALYATIEKDSFSELYLLLEEIPNLPIPPKHHGKKLLTEEQAGYLGQLTSLLKEETQ
jgi:hypothetical protein